MCAVLQFGVVLYGTAVPLVITALLPQQIRFPSVSLLPPCSQFKLGEDENTCEVFT